MPDILDRAAELEEQQRENSLSKIQKFSGESATHCVECGEKIPEKRRELLQGVKLCVSCAEIQELRS